MSAEEQKKSHCNFSLNMFFFARAKNVLRLRQDDKSNIDYTFQAWYLTTSSGLVWQITSYLSKRKAPRSYTFIYFFLFVLLLRNLSAVTVAHESYLGPRRPRL